MLKNITRALSLSLLIVIQAHATDGSDYKSISPQTITQMLEKYGAGFANLEHKTMGDLVQLHLSRVNATRDVVKLTLPNGLELTYGEIIMYGGDLFGSPTKPISNCSKKDQLNCYKAQFESMALRGQKNTNECSNPINIVSNLTTYFNHLESEMAKFRESGANDWDYYAKYDTDISKSLNKLTCGGSFISDFIPFGNYIKLAEVNFDHYVPDSLTAYKTGHRYALETALKGYANKEAGNLVEAEQLLELAYAQNAFANHYLTDSFSAGHMRTPRRVIANDVFLPNVLNLLIANLMHDEDNQHGLNVVNAEGTSWLAFGDGYLFKPEAQLQRSVMLDAMQRSADAIYATYMTGIIPSSYSEMGLLPNYEKIEQLNQSSPLFKVENGVLLKRVKDHDIYDYHWTKYWSGLITLIRFKVAS